ncbi:MAG: prolyl oligopeptidase family serine peptidase [Candidatus Riflebacteria bacterium]|nr:prolyl oligopeptidase family serine peptidase [Candidatus Riflebacteria bacterium]
MAKKKPIYPQSKMRSVKEELHGTMCKDDFRWLEGDDDGKITSEVADWTDQQNAFTRSVLDKLPDRQQLKQRITPLLERSDNSLPVFAGNRIFYFRREGNKNQPSLFMAEHVWEKEQLLIDPEQIDSTGLTNVSWFAPSHDGGLLAYGMARGGDENYQLKILNVKDGSHLSDEISNKVGGVYWLHDNSGFIYSRLADVKNPYSREIRLHLLGDNLADDRLIYAQYKEGPLATTWGPYASLSDDGKWLLLAYHTSTRSNNLWLIDFNAWLEKGEFEKREIIVGSDSMTHAEVVGNKLFIQSNDGTPHGQIYETELARPARSNWHTIVPERTDATIENWDFTGNAMIISYQKFAASELVKYDLCSHKLSDVKLPGLGSASVSCSKEHEDFFIRYESFNYCPAIIHCSGAGIAQKVWWKCELEVDLTNMQVEQHWYESKDGTLISIFLVHRQGLNKDGNNSTLLYGYGGFGISMTPAFSSLIIPWIQDGGVYAVANLRGGGEYGDEWHQAGMLDRKNCVFEDFEAAAEWLIAKKYTTSKKLAISGRSNGGLLTGACMMRCPHLFKAVLCGVPLLDMIRYHLFLMARYWVPEYGCADNEKDFDWLIDYSPYQNVCRNREYPALLLYTGENDTRVHPMHARKMAALLQSNAANSEDQPILLWVDRDSGHGMGKPLSIIVEEQTDQWSFLRWQTGLETTK